jgi:hypothetical protein
MMLAPIVDASKHNYPIFMTGAAMKRDMLFRPYRRRDTKIHVDRQQNALRGEND